MSTVEELIESNKIYQLVTDRLDVIDPNAEDTYARFNMESELMKVIIGLYSDDEDPLPSTIHNDFSIEQILGYLQASHKFYLSKKLPEIEQTMMHIQSRYSESHQLLTALTLFFNEYKNRFIAHIRMEEKDFFPFIKKMISAQEGKMNKDEVTALLKNNSVSNFDDDHDPIEDDLKEVSKIIKEYSAGGEMPMPYSVFLNQVEIFELELRKHAIIEDFILVPMAKELENKLRLTA